MFWYGVGLRLTRTLRVPPPSAKVPAPDANCAVGTSLSFTVTVADDGEPMVYPVPLFSATVTEPFASSKLSFSVGIVNVVLLALMGRDLLLPSCPEATNCPFCETV